MRLLSSHAGHQQTRSPEEQRQLCTSTYYSVDAFFLSHPADNTAKLRLRSRHCTAVPRFRLCPRCNVLDNIVAGSDCFDATTFGKRILKERSPNGRSGAQKPTLV